MPSKIPTVRQIALFPLLLNYVVAAALMVAFRHFYPKLGVLLGAAFFIGLMFLLRITISGSHRKGIKLVKAEAFQEAIPYFEQSYRYFRKHNWLDRFRAIVLLTPSRMKYAEMALANIAFCYSQLGDGQLAIHYYERTLKEFPDNSLANAALRMLQSGKNITA